MSPAAPVAGRNISFLLAGLEAWEEIDVTFLDPAGLAAAWVSPRGNNTRGGDGKLVTTESVFSGEDGTASWNRYGYLDVEGDWSVRIVAGSRPRSTRYSVDQLELEGLEKFTLGTPLSGYKGSHADVYYSEFVASALAVDLQPRLKFAADFLAEQTGVRSEKVPELYLLGNRQLLDLISQATQVELGYEAGYYRTFGIKPGIYIKVDLAEPDVQAILTHEYVHLVMDDVADGKRLPAWLSEGLAGYYEFETGLAGELPDAARQRLYRSTDLAKSAAQDGSLLSLPSLESRSDWNSRTDTAEISLQYAEAHMAVRYISETYGPDSAVAIVTEIGAGQDVAAAVETALGVAYADLDSDFPVWLENWEDPERTASVEYLDSLDGILEERGALLDRRSDAIGDPEGQFWNVEFSELLAEDAEALAARIREATPPASLEALHRAAVTYFDLVAEWLGLETEYVRDPDDDRWAEIVSLIPEGFVRVILLFRDIDDTKFVLDIDQ